MHLELVNSRTWTLFYNAPWDAFGTLFKKTRVPRDAAGDQPRPAKRAILRDAAGHQPCPAKRPFRGETIKNVKRNDVFDAKPLKTLSEMTLST